MRLLLFAVSLLACNILAAASGSIASRDNITHNALEITAHDYPYGTSSPSSVHSAHRRANSLRKRETLQREPTKKDLPIALAQLEISRKYPHYNVKVKFGKKRFSLAIDIDTPFTWIARTGFRCFEPRLLSEIPHEECRMGPLFDPHTSSSFEPLGTDFHVNLKNRVDGHLGRIRFGMGGLHREDKVFTITQTVGAAMRAHWPGDGESSGSLGLEYLSKESLMRDLPNHEGVLETIFQDERIHPIFSLALDRGTRGVLAIGGIPNIPIDQDSAWVKTPLIHGRPGQIPKHIIMVEGFDIIPHPKSSLRKAHNPYISLPKITGLATTTDFVLLPDEVVLHIAKLFDPPAIPIPGWNSLYHVPCSAKAPRVGIKIGGTSYYLSPKDLIEPISTVDPRHPDYDCQLLIEKAGKRMPVLGGAWLRNVLAVFDLTDVVDNEREEPGEYRSGRMWFVGREGP